MASSDSTKLLWTTLFVVTSVSAAFTAVSINRHVSAGMMRDFKHAALAAAIKGDDMFPSEEEEELESEVDWDAEWKKVVSNQGQPETRPGSDFYKSEMEIAAIKAANKAQEQLSNMPKPDVPDMRWNSIKGDWKFWIGVIAIISIGTSLLANSGVQQEAYTNDSFYV